MREQTARERLEGDLLSALAKTYLDQPLRAARVLLESSLMPGHFSDATVREAFEGLREAILARDTSAELNTALQILATGASKVERNFEELAGELCALGTVLELGAR